MSKIRLIEKQESLDPPTRSLKGLKIRSLVMHVISRTQKNFKKSEGRARGEQPPLFSLTLAPDAGYGCGGLSRTTAELTKDGSVVIRDEPERWTNKYQVWI